MDIRQALARVADRRDLTLDDMKTVMGQIMNGEATDAQIGAFLMGLRLKGETVDEITGAVMVMRELASGVDVSGENLVDIVGTGGDGANLFNVSTAASFVVAAGGGRVAKHGNRSVSSSSGSADLLETAGVILGLKPQQVADCVDKVGIGFMFAPAHHSAMRHAIGPRKELGVRTIFNILGPMTNPAGVKRLLIGVYDASLCRPVAEVLNRLGAEHVMVVHSEDGLDEISAAAVSHVAEAKDGVVRPCPGRRETRRSVRAGSLRSTREQPCTWLDLRRAWPKVSRRLDVCLSPANPGRRSKRWSTTRQGSERSK